MKTLPELKQAEIFKNKDFGDPIHLKITPGSDIYEKVMFVADEINQKPTKAARLLILGGWLGWERFRGKVGQGMATNESND